MPHNTHLNHSMKMVWSDLCFYPFPHERNKLGSQRLSHFAGVTKLATGKNVAIRSPGRFIDKGMTRFNEAQRGYIREKMASSL